MLILNNQPGKLIYFLSSLLLTFVLLCALEASLEDLVGADFFVLP